MARNALPEFENLQISVAGARADVVLNRPDKLNPLDWTTVRSLRSACQELDAMDDVRLVVIRGAGKAFSAGGDLQGYLDFYAAPERFAAFLEDFHDLLCGIERSRKIYFAAVNGVCVAGGLELLLACDLAVASADARIGDGHLNYGQLPGAGGSQRLPRAVGAMRARELMFTGRLIDADEAERLGLVAKTAPSGEFDETVDALVASMLAHGARGLAGAKRLVNEGLAMPLGEALRFEIEVVHAYATGDPDAMEGLAAFRDKRPPKLSETLARSESGEGGDRDVGAA
jgi:enoyl-CoA hydratase